ncbi:mitochondrial import inner membrane translocase subunit Tim54 [Xylaria bambusicola]|uniref:mitochondrial import inner membrane translocase subunit Tim54 n=1 Tax=Xylaria bambusicola TaxID=326684 RepID=UPI002008E2F1|nr:mitochondrial import inner membrane translocase subunit Tim54 [Xylaria bambusicola]KAI0505482.1 mitochondrial import inner membrane translocase subunit Tim54 [Xylaria bambusicola]
MADPKPSPATGAATGTPYKAPTPNPALRMMGLPNLPRKLPSRNWLIFWTLSLSFSAAIIYDKREKKRATARWARAVSHIAKEPMATSSEMPRKLTIFLESPPTDGLRVAQDHFTEYVKPVLAASGLDWEFVQGRSEGDVRAAVAERIRRSRDPEAAATAGVQTQDEVVNQVRRRNGIPEYTGMRGDIVIGRHTWKEYVRGLHEGWLGPLTAPVPAIPDPLPVHSTTTEATKEEVGGEEKEKHEETRPEEAKKPERPPQPPPYNTPANYPSSPTPLLIPAELSPSAPVQFPHILGFSNTFTRLGRFLNRRYLADDIGREVAAVCLATAREFREKTTPGTADSEPEQVTALAWEEKDWPKSVWKETEEVAANEKENPSTPPAEKIWTNSIILDPRISMRMRRFELRPEDEARARAIVVPEEEVEGFIKGSLRSLWRWAIAPNSRPQPVVTEE